MKTGTVEWSVNRSPELMLEVWSVASTMEPILSILAEERKDGVRALLSKVEMEKSRSTPAAV